MWQTHWHHWVEKTGGGGGLGGRQGRLIGGHPDAGKTFGAKAAGRNVTIQVNRDGEWCLSLDLSHLCTYSTLIITHPLLSWHLTGSRSSWRALFLCVMLSLSCSVISFFSSPLSRKEWVSRRSTSAFRGSKQPISVSDSVMMSQRCLKDSTNSSFYTHNCDATWGNVIEIIPDASCAHTHGSHLQAATRFMCFTSTWPNVRSACETWKRVSRWNNVHNTLAVHMDDCECLTGWWWQSARRSESGRESNRGKEPEWEERRG